MNIQKSLWK